MHTDGDVGTLSAKWPGDLTDGSLREYDGKYQTLQRQLASMFKDAPADQERITIMLEMMRILENRLVYLSFAEGGPGGTRASARHPAELPASLILAR